MEEEAEEAEPPLGYCALLPLAEQLVPTRQRQSYTINIWLLNINIPVPLRFLGAPAPFVVLQVLFSGLLFFDYNY